MTEQMYKVTFEPLDKLTYVYEVQADSPNNASFIARDCFRFDIGHDRAKDFETSSVEEITNGNNN